MDTTPTWAASLDQDDLRTMHAELAQTTDASEHQAALDAWQRTARIMADPVSRAMLTGDFDLDDMVEVPRP